MSEKSFLSGVARGYSFWLSFILTEVNVGVVVINVCAPLAIFLLANTNDSGRIVAACAAILVVLLCRSEPKVRDSVVSRVAIDVVDLIRPDAIYQKPSHAVSLIHLPINLKNDVSVGVCREDRLSIAACVKFACALAFEHSSNLVIFNRLIEPFYSKHFTPFICWVQQLYIVAPGTATQHEHKLEVLQAKFVENGGVLA